MPRGVSDKVWTIECRVCGIEFRRNAIGRKPTNCGSPACEEKAIQDQHARYYQKHKGADRSRQARWLEKKRIELLSDVAERALLRVAGGFDADPRFYDNVRMVVEVMDEMIPPFQRRWVDKTTEESDGTD